MRALDPEVVEQPDDVVGHVVERVARRALVAPQQLPDGRDGQLVEPRRAADVAVVEADDEEAARGERARRTRRASRSSASPAP